MRPVEHATVNLLHRAAVLALIGCGSIEPVATYAPITDPAQLYMRLTIDHPAINLSTTPPSNTLQLTATPRDALGNAIEGLPAPTFHLVTPDDSTRVRVTADGQITALDAATSVEVIAEVATDANIRHTDTARVNVTTDAPPELVTFSIHPAPPDSAIWPMQFGSTAGFFFFFAGLGLGHNTHPILRALDAADAPISDLIVEYQSLDPAVATIDRWTSGTTRFRPGQVRIVAQTVAYGVAKADTVAFTVTWSAGEDVKINPGEGGAPVFEPATVTIRPFGVVFWFSYVADPVDLTFDDPTTVVDAPAPLCNVAVQFLGPGTYCGSGSVPVFVGSDNGMGPDGWAVRMRQFTTPGAYTYHDSHTGSSGKIVVRDDVPPLP